ncbi:MAG: metallophosphoesterase [Marinicaulis sp.]|nr:metallophosphoesterase [Marinicaulis sp.]NNL89708.1 metallophosphoesterase [Marinicaulis sp.]
MKFAHLTDIHLPIPSKPSMGSLMNKRLLGYLSWTRKRRHRHKIEAANALADDIAGQNCGAVLISGDLVNIALPAEYRAARKWVDEKLSDIPVVFTPGNHDTYVATDWDKTLGLFANEMRGDHGDGDARPTSGAKDFPYVASIGDDVAVIAVNSSPPTAPGLASGSLGQEQLSRLEKMLLPMESDKFRVLMLHHPITDGVVSIRKGLNDAKELRSLIAKYGVDLVLHGHAHVPHENFIDTPSGPAPVIGGASASHVHGHGKISPARCNYFSIARAAAGWTITMEIRQWNNETGLVETIETKTYERPLRENAA